MKFLVLALCVVAALADPHWLIMDANEVEQVQTTWKTVSHNEVDILYNVLNTYPDIQARFPEFADKDIDSLRGTADFAVHAGKIVGFFDKYISLLGSESNQVAIETLLTQLGTSNSDYGITSEQFPQMRSTIISYLKTLSNWNDDFSQNLLTVSEWKQNALPSIS